MNNLLEAILTRLREVFNPELVGSKIVDVTINFIAAIVIFASFYLVWLAAVYTVFNIGGSTLSLPEGFSFPGDIIIWSLVFFVGGFGIYASLMAGVGALVPKMKEAGAANLIVISPLLLGYIIGIMAPLAESAESALPIILSFFPLTAPIVMIMRLTNSLVPLWQLVLSMVLVLATNVLIIRATASIFEAQHLLSGQPFSLKRYLGILFSRN